MLTDSARATAGVPFSNPLCGSLTRQTPASVPASTIICLNLVSSLTEGVDKELTVSATGTVVGTGHASMNIVPKEEPVAGQCAGQGNCRQPAGRRFMDGQNDYVSACRTEDPAE